MKHIVGQKQLEIDLLHKLLELDSQELGFDLKKILAPNYRGVPHQDRPKTPQNETGLAALWAQ